MSQFPIIAVVKFADQTIHIGGSTATTTCMRACVCAWGQEVREEHNSRTHEPSMIPIRKDDTVPLFHTHSTLYSISYMANRPISSDIAWLYEQAI